MDERLGKISLKGLENVKIFLSKGRILTYPSPRKPSTPWFFSRPPCGRQKSLMIIEIPRQGFDSYNDHTKWLSDYLPSKFGVNGIENHFEENEILEQVGVSITSSLL